IASYSASFVRSRSSAPPRTIMRSPAIAQLLDDRWHIVGLHVRAVVMVDRDDGCPPAAAETLDRSERDFSVGGGLAGADAELLLEPLQNLLGSDQGARHVRADLDHVPADGSEMQHVVEGGDRLAECWGRAECIGALAQGLGRQVAVALLRETQRRQGGGAPVRILRLDLLDLVVVGAHRS